MSRRPLLKKPLDLEKRFSRRAVVLGAAQLGVIGVIGLRMRHLQVTEGEKFLLLAEENRINTRLLPPARGLIFDRTGQPIALNQQNFRITVIREQAGNLELVIDRLAQIMDISEEQRERILTSAATRPEFVPVPVAEHLSWEEFARVSANSPVLPGVVPDVGLSREYPMGAPFAHIVGYVGPVSDYDLSQIDDPDPVLRIPDFQIGKTGIERRQEQSLRGSAGTQRIEVNAVGRVMRELDRSEGRPGTDLQLTIDSQLQEFALDRMGQESAATTVMDVQTGDILAMVSAPSFDPNQFVFGISSANWRALNEDDHRPLYNKAVSGEYPPGSTFKMVTVLAALEAGVVTPEERIRCNGFIQMEDRRHHCWRRWGHGPMDLKDGLKQSCDVYYYDIAQRVGIDRIMDMAARLGLGERPDLPLPAVRPGLMPSRDWKLGRFGEPWRVGDTMNASIGQGFVLSTPVQLATMTARIASGLAVSPRLIRSEGGVPLPRFEQRDLGVEGRYLDEVRRGMFAVVNEQRGTAYGSRISEAGMAMAGKTGTSQVRRITAAEREAGITRNEDLPWERRDHALFVGYAPYDAPRYAISVIVEHGGGGSTAAAPIARDVMLRTQQRMQELELRDSPVSTEPIPRPRA